MKLKDKLIIKANDDNLEELVKNRRSDNLNYIDTTNVTSIIRLFRNSDFNGDISKWNTSNVTNTREMFFCSKFNANIVTGKQIGRAHV